MSDAPRADSDAAVPRGGEGSSTRSARRDEALARIVAIATDLFAARGYHATGVAELAKATGLGSGALYHYIGSKEELLFTILTAHLDEVIEHGHGVQVQELSTVEKLHELARHHMRVVASRRHEMVVVLRDLDSLTGERRDEMRRRRDAVEDIWNEVLRHGAERGDVGALDPMFVKIALGALNYTTVWFRPDGPTSPEDMGDRIMTMLLGEASRDRGAAAPLGEAAW